MYWLKTVEGQDVESMATAVDYNRNPSVITKREIYAYNNMLSYHSMKDYQNINMQQVTF